MFKVAISGASGLIGSRIIELLSDDFSFIPLSQRMVDIAKKDQVAQFFQDNQFDFFLHLAAYTNVDGAELEKEKAYAINVEGTKNVFEQSVAKKINFIYISTDFVFDGKNPPFDEESKPNPISYYGLTKYQGEEIVGDEGMIVRIAYPYRARFEPKKDFVRTIYHLLRENKQLTMVENGLMTPTFIDDIAYGLKYLINHYSKQIFHLVGSQSLSPYEAGKLIAQKFNLSEDLISPISYEEYFKNKAKRPQFSQIVSKKNHFHPMGSFEEGLNQIAKMMI